MKKRLLVTVLLVSMVLSFCGCGSKEAKQQASVQNTQDDIDDIEDLHEDEDYEVIDGDDVEFEFEDGEFDEVDFEDIQIGEDGEFYIDDEPYEFNLEDIAGSYVRFRVEEMEGKAATIDERLIINADGTGVVSIQDSIPIKSVTEDEIQFEDGSSVQYTYLFNDEAIIYGNDDDCVFVQSNTEVSDSEEDIMKAREEYTNPDKKNTEVVPGMYFCPDADDTDDTDEWYIEYKALTVADDKSATAECGDDDDDVYSFKSIENGKAVGKDGKEYPCIVSCDTISIGLDEDDGYTEYTTFLRMME